MIVLILTTKQKPNNIRYKTQNNYQYSSSPMTDILTIVKKTHRKTA